MIDCCVDDEIHILSHEIFQYLLLCFVMNYVFVHNYCVILLLILYTQCMSCYLLLILYCIIEMIVVNVAIAPETVMGINQF